MGHGEVWNQNNSTKYSVIIRWQPSLKIANQTYFKSLKVAKRECSEQPQEKCSLVPKEVRGNRQLWIIVFHDVVGDLLRYDVS